ncbi:major facilitator superfamily domain-containing protein [Diplogelasinospora grovesii]|uniref:Major facilitator superfamily domain-containing protein n=1 Tax=Diplogelasinospora grovesii TaxID=303347 RepID=A0AAN6NH57_9PEZI|nr:major facilitator superfamily domain-containing protein [Diplogelasinospora grovesii]
MLDVESSPDLSRMPTETDNEGAEGQNSYITTASSYMAPSLSLPHEIVFVAVVCCAQLTTQAGLSQSLSIIHIIGEHYGLREKPGDLAWFMAAYSLTVGPRDLFGHKRMLITGYLWFAVWSMVAGLAVYSNVILFNFARALQGIGPSILLPNGLAILGSTYPPGPRKHMVFAIFGAMAPGGGVLGSTIAALFALTWWPWAFWSLAIACLFLAGLATLTDGRYRRSVWFWGKLKQVDWGGAITGVTALVLINIAWNQAPIVGWQTPYVYVLLILAVLLIPLRVASVPLLPLNALKSSDIGFVLGCLSCGWGCFGISAWISPVAVSGALAAIATGYLLSKIGPAWTMVAALSAFLAGIILVATMPVDQIYWGQAFVCVLVITWGMDMSSPASTVILSDAVSKRHQGIAASFVNTVVNYSISLALGFAGTAEVHLNNGGKTKGDMLKGYRAALYVGVGLAGLGWLLNLMFFWHDYRRRAQEGRREGEEVEGEKRT